MEGTEARSLKGRIAKTDTAALEQELRLMADAGTARTEEVADVVMLAVNGGSACRWAPSELARALADLVHRSKCEACCYDADWNPAEGDEVAFCQCGNCGAALPWSMGTDGEVAVCGFCPSCGAEVER